MKKLGRVQKCSILGPQNLGSGGGGPGAGFASGKQTSSGKGEKLQILFPYWLNSVTLLLHFVIFIIGFS